MFAWHIAFKAPLIFRGKQILKKKVLRHYMRTKENARIIQFRKRANK